LHDFARTPSESREDSELAKLRNSQEEIEALEADAEALLASYEQVTPDRLDALEAEEHHRIYRLRRLEILAHLDGSLEAQGAYRSTLVVSASYARMMQSVLTNARTASVSDWTKRPRNRL
jgi:hypothetical protein